VYLWLYSAGEFSFIDESESDVMNIELPQICLSSAGSLSQVIAKRRSHREYANTPISLHELSLLLWAAQGCTSTDKHRASPSAGGQYPMDIYVVAANVEGLAVASYHYDAAQHRLCLVNEGDIRAVLSDAAIGEQSWVNEAAVIMILVANFTAMRKHFHDQSPIGVRGERYIYIETGAISQNIHLQATDLGLGMVLVGGYEDLKVQQRLNLVDGLAPTALLCLGRKKRTNK